MRYYFLELLVCPICKKPDLVLHVISERSAEVNVEVEKLKCKQVCGLYGKRASDVPIEECRKCIHREIEEGVLICRECGRWYPIVDGIPHMLPDKYRIKKVDEEFIKKNRDKLPEDILRLMKIPEIV